MQRAELLAEQKERLVAEMAALRRHMAQQEASLKDLLERAVRGDTHLLHSVDLGHLGLVRPSRVPWLTDLGQLGVVRPFTHWMVLGR